MKLGLISGYSGRKMSIPIDAIKHAENLGYESIWTAEAYGSDAVTPAAWILAQTDKIKAGTEEFDRALDAMNIRCNNINSTLLVVGTYKTASIVEKDFTKAKQSEIEKHTTYIKRLSEYMNARLQIHEKIHSENNAEINLTVKPYKKYIKLASKGVNAKRKVLSIE